MSTAKDTVIVADPVDLPSTLIVVSLTVTVAISGALEIADTALVLLRVTIMVSVKFSLSKLIEVLSKGDL